MDMLTKEQELLMASVNDCLMRIAACTEKTSGLIAEAQWADAFHARSKNSSWLKDKTFSLGRWAVGYQYLYALYCFIDEMRPTCVLDLGLGQTTRLIAQYAAANPEVRHVVVESSLEWIEFFKNGSFTFPPNTRIVHCDYGTETFKGVDGVRVYKNFLSAVQGCKFDFVSIDAPLSGDMREFGRVDTIKLISDGLSRRYAILFDDIGRKPDNAGFRALADALRDNGFSERIGCFHGIKWCGAVVSEDLQCLLSNASRRFDPCDSGWQREFADIAIEGAVFGMAADKRRKMLKGASTADMARLKLVNAAIAKRDKWLAESLEKREVLSKKNAELRSSLEKARSDRDAKSQQVKELRDSLEKSRADRDAKSQQVQELRDSLEKARSDRDSKSRQVQELRDSLEKTRSDRDSKSRQVQEFRVACKLAKETAVQIRGQRDKLARTLADITKVVV